MHSLHLIQDYLMRDLLLLYYFLKDADSAVTKNVLTKRESDSWVPCNHLSCRSEVLLKCKCYSEYCVVHSYSVYMLLIPNLNFTKVLDVEILYNIDYISH